VLRAAQAVEVEARVVGVAGGDRLVLPAGIDVAVADATATWRDRLPSAMGAGATH
jgi:phosphoribosylformylglycinamidine synthase subunit PurL